MEFKKPLVVAYMQDLDNTRLIASVGVVLDHL